MRGEQLPLIIPTRSGYQFARGLERWLREHYLPRRGLAMSEARDLWVPTSVTTFSDTSGKVLLERHIRGEDVFVVADVQSHATLVPMTHDTPNEAYVTRLGRERCTIADRHGRGLLPVEAKVDIDKNFQELLRTIEAARDAVTRRGYITAVLPWLPYSRQDRRTGRESLDLQMAAVQLEAVGVDYVLTIDVHNRSTGLAFRPPVKFDNLKAAHTLLHYLRSNPELYPMGNAFFVAPDAGAFEMNKLFGLSLDVPFSLLYKEERDATRPNVAKSPFGLVGDTAAIRGCDVYTVDDMIDTAGTLINAAASLRELGAASVTAIATHPVLSPPATLRLARAVEEGILKAVVVTNSITLSTQEIEACQGWLRIVDVQRYFAKAVDCLDRGESISKLLQDVT